ncbi:hypothetical protein C0993_000606 [Termitomyces sp. T159_Od127]|nr:hypothetical protein C0993_000606 [Termitomyces sp. T159_Od127]
MHALQPPVHSSELKVDFPADHVLLLTLNRPRSLNAMTPTMAEDLEKKSRWNNSQQQNKTDEQQRLVGDVYGFGSLSRRQLIKPVIAAVSGGAYGGGVEIVLNSDIVIAGAGAKFALPEAKRGVVAIQGGMWSRCDDSSPGFHTPPPQFPRHSTISTHRGASGTYLQTCLTYSVNRVVPPSEVLSTALDVAQEITSSSPDATQATKEGLLISQRLNYHQTHLVHAASPVSTRVFKGANIKEGLKAFTEKRAPVWKNPAKL